MKLGGQMALLAGNIVLPGGDPQTLKLSLKSRWVRDGGGNIPCRVLGIGLDKKDSGEGN